jgi:hypothetical protein
MEHIMENIVCTILSYTILPYTILPYTILPYTILPYTILPYTIPCHAPPSIQSASYEWSLPGRSRTCSSPKMQAACPG